MHRPFILIIAVLFAVLVTVPRAGASGYGYVAPVVVTPTVVAVQPVPVALFQYAAPATTPPPVLLAPSLLAQQQKREDELAAEVARLRAAVQQLQREKVQARAELSGPPAVADDDGPPALAEEPPPQAVAQGREALLVRAAQIATTRCSQCHSGAKARGEVLLFNAAGVFEPNTSFDEIYRSVTRQRRAMPLNDPAGLSAAEKLVFKALRDAESAGR